MIAEKTKISSSALMTIVEAAVTNDLTRERCWGRLSKVSEETTVEEIAVDWESVRLLRSDAFDGKGRVTLKLRYGHGEERYATRETVPMTFAGALVGGRAQIAQMTARA